MLQTIKLKRGLKANLPAKGMQAGEPLVTTDRGTLHLAVDELTRIPLVPAIDDLATLAAIDGASDYLIIHDGGETSGQKEKKISFSGLKSALNIPDASTDELVAVVQGGTAGYVWGSDGTDGVMRMGPSMSWSMVAAGGYVMLEVGTIDGGTF